MIIFSEIDRAFLLERFLVRVRMSSFPSPPEVAAPARDDGRRPRSLANRLGLGLILLLLPATAVCVPIFVVSHFFGRRPRSKPPQTELLQQSLERSADYLLPTPPPLGPDTVTVTVRAEHLAARLKKVSDQAQALGGSASEGLSTPTEKHLSVALPAGRAEAFRQAVNANTAPGSLSSPAASPGAAQDFVDVVIRAAGDDE